MELVYFNINIFYEQLVVKLVTILFISADLYPTHVFIKQIK